MDPYEHIVAFYDCEHANFDEDIRFYRHVLLPGSVLEVGTGTGRIAAALLDSGYTVHAVDPSPAALARAGRRIGTNPRATLERASLPVLRLEATFNNVVLSLNTLWHVTDAAEQEQALGCLGAALEPGGLLFLDQTNPLSMADRGARGEVRERYRGPCDDSTLTVLQAAWDDEGNQSLVLHLTYECISPEGQVRKWLVELPFRYLYRSELELMVRAAGLHVRAVFGSYDLEPYDTNSENLIVVAARS